MTIPGPTLVTICLWLAVVVPVNAVANESLLLTLSAGQESNVPRGIDEQHELDSSFLGAEVFAGKFWQLGLNDSLLLGATLDARRYGELSGFQHLGAALSATYSHKFGFGAYAPRLDLGLRYRQQRGPGKARDFDENAVLIALQKRLSPALQLRAGVESSHLHSDTLPKDPAVTAFGYDPVLRPPFELFDYRTDSYFLAADYTFANQVMLTANYTRANGNIVASTTTPNLATYKISRAFYSDPAFEADWFAYRLDSNSHQLSTAISIPLGPDMGLDLSVDLVDINAPGARSYTNQLYTVSVTRGF
jgi:hypothetical protein